MSTKPVPEQTLVHFYRAVVVHMDVWRQRMDATTNWAAAASAGMITFAFGATAVPHFILLIAAVFQCVFLLMESRRYQTFDLWRRRFRVLNRYLIGPALRGDTELPDDARIALADLSTDLGRTVPHMGLLDAIGYRIRRNYGYLFSVTLVAWVLRLETQPYVAGSATEFFARARVGAVAGEIVLVSVLLAVTIGMVVALRAPSEQMVNWAATPAPLSRWLGDAEDGDTGRA